MHLDRSPARRTGAGLLTEGAAALAFDAPWDRSRAHAGLLTESATGDLEERCGKVFGGEPAAAEGGERVVELGEVAGETFSAECFGREDRGERFVVLVEEAAADVGPERFEQRFVAELGRGEETREVVAEKGPRQRHVFVDALGDHF